jgi:hypothetical protein
MEVVQVTREERQVLDAMRASAELKGAFAAMVAVAQSGELASKPVDRLAKAAATPPQPETAPTITIEQMKNELRAADCLYDKAEIWEQLGAKNVPALPDSVIQEAYEKGGRVVLKCSSISEKAYALREAGFEVCFGGTAEQRHYEDNVSNPEWIVVQSHIYTDTLGRGKRDVVTADKPEPTPEDWYAAIAYARLDGRRQPQGCENLYAFTAETGTVVGSSDNRIFVYRNGGYDPSGPLIGAARFGPPRN